MEEELLKNFNDDDSDDSDTEDASKNTTTTPAAPPKQQQQQQQPPAATPAAAVPPPAQNPANVQQRLKSLYSQANAKPRTQPSQPPPQQQQQQPKPPQQQQHPPHAMQPSRPSPHATNPASGGYQQPHPSTQARTSNIHHSQQAVPQQQARQVVSSQAQQQRRPSSQMPMNQGYPSSQRPGGPTNNVVRRGMPVPPRGTPMSRVTSDPFEPTPVSKMIGAPTSSTTTNNPNAYPKPTYTTGRPASGQPYRPPQAASNDRSDAQRKQKEKFLIFTRVLMKYLEQKDPKIHVQVKEIIRDCAQRNSRKEEGYESVTAAMRRRLKEVVNDQYWQRAEVYLEHFLKQKGKASSSSSSTSRPSSGRPDPNAARSSAVPQRSIPAPRPPQTPLSVSSSRPSSSMPPPESREDPKTKPRSRSSGNKKVTTPKSAGTPTSPRPQTNDDALKSVDYALPYNGSALGDNMHTMLTAEQSALLYDVPTKKKLPPSFPLPNWRKRNVVSVRTAFVRSGRSAWVNEDIAARDNPVLAALSEGAQIYLKSVLEKALHAARQRQNLDAIRLWHQQHSSQPPEIGIRLGCDVNRQLALSQANDTLTVKRMEAALERRPESESTSEVNEETMLEATSMSDLALKPKLSKAQKELGASTKRSLDVFLGQGRHEPPFGRVPKVAKLEVVDFETGMQFVAASRFQKAGTYRSSFFF